MSRVVAPVVGHRGKAGPIVTRPSREQFADRSAEDHPWSSVPVDVASLVSGAAVRGRGIQPAGVAFPQRMQGIHGNQAVQRYLAQSRGAAFAAPSLRRSPTDSATAGRLGAARPALRALIQRDLDLDNPDFSGNIKMTKLGGNAELAGALETSKGVILMEYVEGKTLGKHKNASVESAEVRQFQSNPENLKKIGRMVVFDAAILNSDRFKLEFGGAANSGNLLVGQQGPVGVDQDFAKIGEEDALEDYKDMFVAKLKPLLADPAALAAALVAKMEREGYALLTGGEKLIETGVKQGIEILGGLAAKSNNRIEKLVEWAKTFVEGSGLKSSPIREYWNELLAH